MNLRKEEFRLDFRISDLKKIIEANEDEAAVYQAKSELPHVQRQLSDVQHRIYGWRFFAKDSKERMLEKLETLRRRVLQLENQQIEFQKTIDNYSFHVKQKETDIQRLQGHMASGDVGYIPKPEEIEKANEELLEIHRKAGHAEINLPRVEKELAKAKAELEKLEASWEKAKNHTSDQTYESPGVEVDSRAKEYMAKHGGDYSSAMNKILAGDPILGFAYLGK